MIQWVIENVSRASGVSRLIVATDDSRIQDAAEKLGIRVVRTSPEHRSGTDRVAEAADVLKIPGDDIVVNVQGDQPLIDPRSIQEVSAPFFTDPELQMSTLAIRADCEAVRNNPKDVKVVFDRQGYALYFSRAPIPFAREPVPAPGIFKHLGVYAYTRKFLDIFRSLPEGDLENIEKLEQLRALEYGYRIKVVLTGYDSPEVDVPDDIVTIETLLNRT
jgi:3-deoxy-manno-octulosonate cytidylyltransferase (CMP-KDO synthetase)